MPLLLSRLLLSLSHPLLLLLLLGLLEISHRTLEVCHVRELYVLQHEHVERVRVTRSPVDALDKSQLNVLGFPDALSLCPINVRPVVLLVSR